MSTRSILDEAVVVMLGHPEIDEWPHGAVAAYDPASEIDTADPGQMAALQAAQEANLANLSDRQLMDIINTPRPSS